MDAGDDLMRSALLWFREGPPTRFYRPESDWAQLPSLRHEMATSEPCYSWNLFHSWQLGDRLRFLEGMYSLFAGAYSRQTYTVCETRGGITGCTHWLPSVLLARLAVIDDQIAEGELHLLRLMPLAWLKELDADPSRLNNEITLIDNAFTRPWTVLKQYRRVAEKHPDWPEDSCDTEGMVLIGKETYFKSGDGTIMPTHKDQAPPDLRYFPQSSK